MHLATRSSLERLTPVALGVPAAGLAVVLSPDSAASSFFSTSAQIIPVLLLALVLEARLFGLARRALLGHPWARRVEGLRRLLELGTVLALLAAEAQALYALRDAGDHDPRLTSAGLAWGFVAIAAIAVRGIGRPRVTADLTIVSEDEGNIVLQVGASNEFGDRDVRPLRNVLFGPGAQVAQTHAAGKAGWNPGLTLAAPVTVGGERIPCQYAADQPLLTAGDAHLLYYRLTLEAEAVLVVVRLDHIEFPGGRVETAAFVRRGPHLEMIDGRTG